MTNRSRCALMSRGRKSKTKSSLPCSTGSDCPPASAGSAASASAPANVANETRSPKFDFMNSAIFVFSSSGEGKGGGGFCSMCRDYMIAPKIYHPKDGCKSDSQGQNSFILPGMQVPSTPLNNDRGLAAAGC